jgi:hypothetical protein
MWSFLARCDKLFDGQVVASASIKEGAELQVVSNSSWFYESVPVGEAFSRLINSASASMTSNPLER